jgi:hypothetical protein
MEVKMKYFTMTLLAAVLLAGCVVSPAQVAVVGPCAAYAGPVGFYDEGCGYWAGPSIGWDVDFYAVGHPGYGRGHWHPHDKRHAGHADKGHR